MGIAYLLTALVAVAVTVFALQNGQPTSLRFFGWSLESVPLAGALLFALASGIVIAGVPLWLGRWRWRSRARAAESRAAMLETALADRDAALLKQRPAPPARQG